jgi:hypothetical protein
MNWTQPPLPRRPMWLAGVAILALGSAGCGASATPSDATEGTQVLQTVLDAWKKGDKPDSLAARTPPIHATDADWMSGLRLQGYKADGEGTLIGSDVSYKVRLDLKTPKGKVVKKDVVYSVTTYPLLRVLRQDD